MNNLPLGAEYDSNAPFNQKDISEKIAVCGDDINIFIDDEIITAEPYDYFNMIPQEYFNNDNDIKFIQESVRFQDRQTYTLANDILIDYAYLKL